MEKKRKHTMVGVTGSLRALAALLAWAMVACASHEQPPAAAIDRTEVDGPGTLGLSERNKPVTGVVVYFHGMAQGATVTELEAKRKGFTEALLRAGYAVVSADAGGDAFGNEASRDDYRRLIRAAEHKYATATRAFVAESMGGLPALALLSQDSRIKGMVGISPMMGLPANLRSVKMVTDAWNGNVPDSADPLSWPPSAFAGRTFRLYVSGGDNVIPPGARASNFAQRFGPVASVHIIGCPGTHAGDNCFDGDGVVHWLADLPK